MTTVTYDANKADGSDTDWTSIGAALPVVASNRWVNPNSSPTPTAGTRAHGLTLGAAGVTFEFDRQTSLGAVTIGLVNGSFNGYVIVFGNVSYKVSRLTGGAIAADIASGSGTTSQRHAKFTMTNAGAFELFADGTSVATGNDTTYALSGLTLVFIYEAGFSSVGWVDNIQVTDSVLATVTGTSARTLSNFTSAASGSTVTGTSTPTLAAFTSTASGSSVTGTSARTLAAFASTASGTASGATITGTSAQTLSNFTSAASGSTTTGTSSRTLSNFTSTATGAHGVTGTSARTLAAFTSTASGSVANVPGAPTVVRPADAFGYGSEVDLDWEAPASDGGATITGYRIRVSDDDGDNWTTHTANTGSSTTSATLTGLTNGTRYVFEVAAINAAGTGTGAESEWGSTPTAASAPQSLPTGTTLTSAPWNLDRLDQRSLPLSTTFHRPWNGAGVWVYIVDSGFELTHDELATVDFETGYSSVSEHQNTDGYLTKHGTRMSGLIAGPTAGVVPGVTIVPVKAITADGTESDIQGAWEWVRDNPPPPGTPAIAITSLLFAAAEEPDGGAASLAAMQPIIDAIIDDNNMAVVICAGNTFGFNIEHLPPRTGLIVVGGSTIDDAVWTSTRLDDPVDIFAPAENIYLLNPNTTSDYYATSDGTSFATPIVAAVMASWLAANNDLTAAQLHDLLIASSTKDELTGDTGGWPNRLVYSLADIPPAVVEGTVTETLAAFTSTAVGGHGISGTSSRTLSNFTSTAAGSTVTGSASETLDAFTSSAAGTHTTTGTVAATLTAFTSTASGTATPPTVTGTTAVTLNAFTSTATGSTVTGTAAETLDAFTASASGTANPPGIAGLVAETLDAFTGSGAGSTVTGSSSTTLTNFTSTASGTAAAGTVTGTSASTLGAFTGAAAGSTTTGVIIEALDAFTAAAIGATTVGSIAEVLAAFTSTAVGGVGELAADVNVAVIYRERSHARTYREPSFARPYRQGR